MAIAEGKKVPSAGLAFLSDEKKDERGLSLSRKLGSFAIFSPSMFQVENTLSTYDPHSIVVTYSVVERSSFQV